jgi:hypothetical protein
MIPVALEEGVSLVVLPTVAGILFPLIRHSQPPTPGSQGE